MARLHLALGLGAASGGVAKIAPTGVVLSNTELQDNAANGTLIGTLLAIGPGTSYGFALTSDPSAKLSISGNQLLVAGSLSGLTTYGFSVRATDAANGLGVTQALTLAISATPVTNPSGVGTGDGTITTPDPTDPAADQDGFITVPVTADTSAGLKLAGKNGGSATFFMDLGAPVNGRAYIMKYDPDWSGMSLLGQRAEVGFAFKAGNDFHLAGLRGNGQVLTTLLDSRVSGDFRKANKFSISSDGNAHNGTKDGPNWLKLAVAADGTTYTLSSSPDGVTWAAEYTAQLPSPLAHVSSATQFGPGGYFAHQDYGVFSMVIEIFSGLAGTLNPLDISPELTLASGNLKATKTTASLSWETVRSQTSHASGKYYWEWKLDAEGSNHNVAGFLNATAPLTGGVNAFVGTDSNGVGLVSNGQYVISKAFTNLLADIVNGDICGMAIDLDNHLVWFRTNAGSWNGSGMANPATGAGGIATPSGLASGAVFAGLSLYDGIGVASDASEANFGGSAFAHTPPAGFSAWH